MVVDSAPSLASQFRSAVPSIGAQPCSHLELGTTGQIAELMELHGQVNQMVSKLFGHISEPHIDGANDKLSTWQRSPAFTLRLLPPYQGFKEEEAYIASEASNTDFAVGNESLISLRGLK